MIRSCGNLRLADVILVAHPDGDLPYRVELGPAWHYDAEREFANDLLQLPIAFQGRHSIPTFARACNRAAAFHGSRFASVCSALCHRFVKNRADNVSCFSFVPLKDWTRVRAVGMRDGVSAMSNDGHEFAVR